MNITYIDRTEFRRGIDNREQTAFGFTVRRNDYQTAFCSWETHDKVPKDNVELFRLAVRYTPNWDWRDLTGDCDKLVIDRQEYDFTDYYSEDGNPAIFGAIIDQEMTAVEKEIKNIAEQTILVVENGLKENAGTGFEEFYDNMGTVGSRWVPVEQNAMWVLIEAIERIRRFRPEAKPDPETDAQVAIIIAATERLGIAEWKDTLR